MIRLAIIAGATFRRVLGLRSMLLAAILGLMAGLLVAGIPEARVAQDMFGPLVVVLSGLLVLPIAAGAPTADRDGGFAAITAMRPVSSTSWALGRVFGALSGLGLLVVIVASTAMAVAGRTPVPDIVHGVRADGGPPAHTEWRFGLPAGSQGPFDLRLELLMLSPNAVLELDVRRSRAREVVSVDLVAQRSVTVPLPGLAPARGDLFVTVRPDADVLPSTSSAQLTVGLVPIGNDGLKLPRSGVLAILMGVLAVVAFASAFRFETACLAGLLGLTVPRGGPGWWATAALALLVAVLGTALSRRQAMP